ncbi:zinc finger protein 431-like isoform X2 [Anneissia japonica]|uniref:zinc finger protein 431-like isoform X2 n=1 Tax=Anneissia japonica TaxID=1529436 RepID=UPI0014258176|nr:zinc finger protein 431-like isoform X2 [Anneissia japonica]
MEEVNEDYDDTHHCLKCDAHISGLQNYIQHRKTTCNRQMVSQPTQHASLQPTILKTTLQPSSLQLESNLQNSEAVDVTEKIENDVKKSSESVSELLNDLSEGILKETEKKVEECVEESICSEGSIQVNSKDAFQPSEVAAGGESVSELLLNDLSEGILKETEKKVEECVEESICSEGSIQVNSKVESQSSEVAADEDYDYSRYLEASLLGNINTDYRQTRANKQSMILASKKEKAKLNLDGVGDEDVKGKNYRKTRSANKNFVSPQKQGNDEESTDSSDVITDIEENHEKSPSRNKSVKKKMKVKHSNPKTWTCPVCAKVLRARAGPVHMRIHNGDKPFKCHLCTYASVTQSDMRMHMKRHLGIKEFKCTECDYATSRKSLLRTHNHRHQREKGLEDLLYQCDECGKRYATMYGLKGHIKAVHENHRPFTCSFENCKYACVSNCELQIHIRTHTKEKPFLCTQCGYKATNKNRLMRHMITHTDEKPFKCDYPGCTFVGKTAFRVTRHKKQHDPENRLFCPYCSYTTFYLGNLRKHIKNTAKHKNTKVYLCDICKTFKTDVYKDLINHYDDAHKGDVEVTVHSGGLKLGQFNNSRQTEDVSTEDTIVIIPEEVIVVENNVAF